MTKEELYLKTVFCCIACDGEIAPEEIDMVRELCAKDSMFSAIDAETYLNKWVSEINERGGRFLQSYLKEIHSVELDEKDQLFLVSLAIKAIEADNRIEYAEIKFFKKIRARLSVSDDMISAEHPDKEDFLLPDINVEDMPQWDDNTHFSQISFKNIDVHGDPRP